jgi:hypothetical protein
MRNGGKSLSLHYPELPLSEMHSKNIEMENKFRNEIFPCAYSEISDTRMWRLIGRLSRN